MYQLINIGLAARLGIHVAIALQCLIEGMEGTLEAEVECAKGDVWVRMGHRTLALHAPYLTPHMAKRALRKLVDKRICRTMKLGESPFDHTYWYALTNFGYELIQIGTDKKDTKGEKR